MPQVGGGTSGKNHYDRLLGRRFPDSSRKCEFHGGVIGPIRKRPTDTVLVSAQPYHPTRRQPMLICRILAIMVVLSAVLAMTPASAQQVMSEPAYCAFFYPYANCQNKGPGNPYTDPTTASTEASVPALGQVERPLVLRRRASGSIARSTQEGAFFVRVRWRGRACSD